MKLLALAALTLGALNANAITSTFKFEIKSSGPDMYPCNAGLRHLDRGSQVVTNVPDGTLATNDDASNYSGDNLMDYMKADLGTWDGDNFTLTTANKTVVGKYVGGYATLFGNNAAINDLAASYGKRISNLSFNLTTERYGAEFFVDLCYRKPQLALDGVGANVTTQAWVAITDTNASKSYVALSNLANKTDVYCSTGDNETGSYSRSSNSFLPITSASFAEVLPSAFTNGVPNKCIVRFYFSENGIQNKRSWQQHGASVQVRAEIVEPAL